MKEVIKSIFNGNAFCIEKCGESNEKILVATKRVNEAYDELVKLVGSENEEVIERYEDLICELNMLFYEEYFTKGFEIGHKLAFEILK
ncbi:MAG: hypothetical protein J6K52_03590 [Clostridia bacterium]|nr:hypothetical protein [Clostridia bacterium]MBQ7788639.1 hypothetical protein [Clostridia bacterium]